MVAWEVEAHDHTVVRFWVKVRERWRIPLLLSIASVTRELIFPKSYQPIRSWFAGKVPVS